MTEGEKEGQVTPAGEMLHSKAPLIKVHEHTEEDSIGREETLLQSARVCVCVCSVVLHPAVLLDESVNHLLHGQIGDQLILGQRAAGDWVKMANTLQREREHQIKTAVLLFFHR